MGALLTSPNWLELTSPLSLLIGRERAAGYDDEDGIAALGSERRPMTKRRRTPVLQIRLSLSLMVAPHFAPSARATSRRQRDLVACRRGPLSRVFFLSPLRFKNGMLV